MSGIVDAHNDLLLELAHRRGEPNPFAAHWLPQLRRGGVRLQVCPTFVDIEEIPGALRTALGQVAAFHRALRDNPDTTVRVRSREDLAAVAGGDRIGLMLSVEGAEPLGYDPWMAEVLFDLGVRMLGLTWNRRNPFADGVAESSTGGLSRLGRELVDLCGRLGIIVDLAHASEQTFWDVIGNDGGASLTVSHACCRALLDHPRNLSDDQLRALADRGGVLGLMLHPIVIDERAPSIDRAIDHLDHAVEVMGIEHVGLGGDFTRQVVRALGYVPPSDALLPDGMPIDAALDGLAGPEDYPTFEAALERRGYRDDRLEAVLSGNYLRFLGDALPTTA